MAGDDPNNQPASGSPGPTTTGDEVAMLDAAGATAGAPHPASGPDLSLDDLFSGGFGGGHDMGDPPPGATTALLVSEMPPRVRAGSGILQQQANPLDMSASEKYRRAVACGYIAQEMALSLLPGTVRVAARTIDVFPTQVGLGTVLAYMLALLDSKLADGASAGSGWDGRQLNVREIDRVGSRMRSLRVSYLTSDGPKLHALGIWHVSNARPVCTIANQRPAAVAACVVAQEVVRDLAATTRAAVVARITTTCAQLGWPVHELDEQSAPHAVFVAAVEVALAAATNTSYGAASVVAEVKRRAKAALKTESDARDWYLLCARTADLGPLAFAATRLVDLTPYASIFPLPIDQNSSPGAALWAYSLYLCEQNDCRRGQLAFDNWSATRGAVWPTGQQTRRKATLAAGWPEGSGGRFWIGTYDPAQVERVKEKTLALPDVRVCMRAAIAIGQLELEDQDSIDALADAVFGAELAARRWLPDALLQGLANLLVFWPSFRDDAGKRDKLVDAVKAKRVGVDLKELALKAIWKYRAKRPPSAKTSDENVKAVEAGYAELMKGKLGKTQ